MPFPMLTVFLKEITVLRAQEGLHAVHVASLGGGNVKKENFNKAMEAMRRQAGIGVEKEKVKRDALTEDKAKSVLSWLGGEADEKSVAQLVKADKRRFGST